MTPFLNNKKKNNKEEKNKKKISKKLCAKIWNYYFNSG